MKQSLGLRLGQSLTMTPALQQAIRLLQLSTLDLQQEIQQVLDSNLMLERDDGPAEAEAGADAAADADAVVAAAAEADAPPAEVGTAEVIPEEMPVDADWRDVYDGEAPASKSTSSNDDDLHDFLQANLHAGPTLREHLLWQVKIGPFDPVEAEVALNIVDAINDDGYLENWGEIAPRLRETLGVSDAVLDTVLKTVQEFDPAGVGARDLAECLRLQLLQLDPGEDGMEAALRLIGGPHMALLARRDAGAIARALNVGVDEAGQAIKLIQSLQPHPGRPFQAHESNYIAPDVFVTKRSGRWRVSLNPEHAPKLRINSFYQSMIKRADTSRDQVTLKQHLQEARYFINSLEARNETLLRVAQCIVEEQRAFLEYGEEAMRPLVLRDVAEQLGIHESTVSRATANKYMLTPRGLFELKYFFSSHVQTTQGGVCSATAIQAMIRRLIAGEDPSRPLSDATLAEVLLKDGIQVARRTVAKYREGLGIPPSHERKPPA